ncbi:MAG: hypothetical protein KDG89_00430 [Geminicoccaceae bacterium]|nr:hypothetical protein [Geminicoccaceae bacterium]
MSARNDDAAARLRAASAALDEARRRAERGEAPDLAPLAATIGDCLAHLSRSDDPAQAALRLALRDDAERLVRTLDTKSDELRRRLREGGATRRAAGAYANGQKL